MHFARTKIQALWFCDHFKVVLNDGNVFRQCTASLYPYNNILSVVWPYQPGPQLPQQSETKVSLSCGPCWVSDLGPVSPFYTECISVCPPYCLQGKGEDHFSWKTVFNFQKKWSSPGYTDIFPKLISNNIFPMKLLIGLVQVQNLSLKEKDLNTKFTFNHHPPTTTTTTNFSTSSRIDIPLKVSI